MPPKWTGAVVEPLDLPSLSLRPFALQRPPLSEHREHTTSQKSTGNSKKMSHFRRSNQQIPPAHPKKNPRCPRNGPVLLWNPPHYPCQPGRCTKGLSLRSFALQQPPPSEQREHKTSQTPQQLQELSCFLSYQQFKYPPQSPPNAPKMDWCCCGTPPLTYASQASASKL